MPVDTLPSAAKPVTEEATRVSFWKKGYTFVIVTMSKVCDKTFVTSRKCHFAPNFGGLIDKFAQSKANTKKIFE